MRKISAIKVAPLIAANIPKGLSKTPFSANGEHKNLIRTANTVDVIDQSVLKLGNILT